MQVLTVSSPSALTRADVSAPLKCKPPSYGPSVDEYCVRHPLLSLLFPLSSSHATRNCIIRSGSSNCLAIQAYFGALSNSGASAGMMSSNAYRVMIVIAQAREFIQSNVNTFNTLRTSFL
jgi:hypothetical protein